MRNENRSLEWNDSGLLRGVGEPDSAKSNAAESVAASKAIVRNFFASLESMGVRYCHWKSNIRLKETLAAAEDIDLLVNPRDGKLFYAVLLENGFKVTQSRAHTWHPGVLHALGLDEITSELVHVHAYFQIVTGDSLVKSYRLPIEGALLAETRCLYGVKVPTPEAELVLFALRIALKHTGPIEILMANRDYRQTSQELHWLMEAANVERAGALCTAWFPTIEPLLFRQLLRAIASKRGVVQRIVLGRRIARRLGGFRRLNPWAGALSRTWRLLSLLAKRVDHRGDFLLQTGGMIVALVGPKATGKSTIGHALTTRLGRYLDVVLIHSGKPPATALSLLPRLFVPAARRLFAKERSGEYEKVERRREQRYSLLYTLRMTLLAYDRRRLLQRALRAATAGRVVISDRYPSQSPAAIDSCCFDDVALKKCRSPLKRWLMQRERALYRGLPQPDLLLRLAAPIETTIERDARRLKRDAPDADALRRRWELEVRPEFVGTPEIRVDTKLPLDVTIQAVVGAVWTAL